jgi:hypothetical protein
VTLGRIVVGWGAVAAWLLLWLAAERRLARTRPQPRARARPAGRGRDGWWVVGEALLLTLLAALWFGSLGAGMGWLVFLLIGGLMAWPVRTVAGAARVVRVLAAGVLLSRLLGP